MLCTGYTDLLIFIAAFEIKVNYIKVSMWEGFDISVTASKLSDEKQCCLINTGISSGWLPYFVTSLEYALLRESVCSKIQRTQFPFEKNLLLLCHIKKETKLAVW